MAGMVLSLLSSTWFPLDLSAHQDALILTGNLLAGKAEQRNRNIALFLLLASEYLYLTLLGKILGRLSRKKRQNFTLMRFETLPDSRLFSSEQLNFIHIC